MDSQTLILVACVAAVGVSAYVAYKCSQKGLQASREHYHQPRYCPQGKVWCDFAHTCVPYGKCHH